jgi:hypothetical protein
MRAILIVAACLIVTVGPAAEDVPITSFETEADMQMFAAGSAVIERVQEHASDGEWSLKIEITGSETDTWPGVSFIPPDPDLSECMVLAFDVYNGDADYAALSYRVDDGNGKKRFEGARLNPGKSTTVEIYVKPMVSDLDISNIVKFYLYSRMPRRDYTWYLDNFRYTDGSREFKPRRYLETTPEIVPTADEQARGFALFHRHWMDLVFPTSIPTDDQREVNLRTFATPGEHEPLTVSLRALRDLTDARVTVSDLRGEDGAIIPASEITIYPIRCLNKRETYPSEYYIEDMPVVLERRESVNVAAGVSQRFWLSIHVPEDAQPGSYAGTVTVSADGDSVELPLTVEALPFKLDDPEGIFWGEYYSGPKLVIEDPTYREAMRAELADMRAHGMTSVGLCFGPTLECFEVTDDGVKVNYGDERYVWFMDAYVELGFPAPVIQLSDSPQSAFGSQYPLQSEEFAQAYKSAWAAMQAEAARRGWPEVIVQPVDEPGWKDQAAKDRTVRLLELLKQVPGLRTEQDGPGDDFFHDAAGPHADVWNYNGGVAAPERVAQAIADGHIVTCYNNDVECYRPGLQRYAAGVFLLASGTHGIYNWSYGGWKGNPYDDQDAKYGDLIHVYPATERDAGGPATGWEGFREGADDYKYCDLLRRTIARARAAGKNAEADTAQDVFDDMIASIEYSPRLRYSAKFDQVTTDADGVSRIGGRMQVRNGWEFARYDEARRQVADQILALMTALGEL